MKKYFLAFLLGFSAVPFVGSAAATVGTIGQLLTWFTDLINAIIPFLLVVATLYVIWGIFQFVTAAGDEEGRKTGRDKMIYGIIGLFLMLSVWGLVNLLVGSLGFTDTTIQAPPVLNIPAATTGI